MSGRTLSAAVILAVASALSGCAAVPHAVVAVPKNQTKPLYQINRLEQVAGGDLRWVFVNDWEKPTVLRFQFENASIFKPLFPLVCVTVQTSLNRTRAKSEGRTMQNGPTFPLPAATPAGPAVCTATLTLLDNLKPDQGQQTKEYPYKIFQDDTEKLDPVIVIRTR